MLYKPKKIDENSWFEIQQPLLKWIANTDYGRDLLCIDKDFPQIQKIGKNYVRSEIEPGTHITDFRIGAKWANVIRFRWKEFQEYAEEYYRLTHGVPQAFPVATVPGYAYATETFYPDAGEPGTTTIDGTYDRTISGTTSANWDTVHDSTASNSVDATSSENTCVRSRSGGGETSIIRALFLFDTASIDDAATITSATFSLYGTGSTNDDNDGDDWITVVQSNPASNTEMAVGDFDQVGDAIDNPTEAIDNGDRIDIGSYSTSGYNDFPFNSTGLGWVDSAGITKLGVREGHDVIDSQVSNTNAIRAYFADQAGTSADPKLVVVSSLPFTPKAVVVI